MVFSSIISLHYLLHFLKICSLFSIDFFSSLSLSSGLSSLSLFFPTFVLSRKWWSQRYFRIPLEHVSFQFKLKASGGPGVHYTARGYCTVCMAASSYIDPSVDPPYRNQTLLISSPPHILISSLGAVCSWHTVHINMLYLNHALSELKILFKCIFLQGRRMSREHKIKNRKLNILLKKKLIIYLDWG